MPRDSGFRSQQKSGRRRRSQSATRTPRSGRSGGDRVHGDGARDGGFSSALIMPSRRKHGTNAALRPWFRRGSNAEIAWKQRSRGGALWRVDAAPAPEPPWQIPSRAVWSGLRHVVDPGSAPGLATQQPRQGHPAAAPESEPLDRFVAIDRAGRQMPAVVTDQRRERVPVNPDHGPPGIARQSPH
jgi:hypothetical protein